MFYSQQCGGYMSAIGFNQTDVVIQKCAPDSIKLMPNISNMVFRVLPKLVYDATRDYNKEKKNFNAILKKIAAMENAKVSESIQKKEEDLNAELEHSTRLLAVMQQRMNAEQEQNSKISKNRTGEIVLYGASIQFQHLDSKAFLQVSKISSEMRKEQFKVELSENPSPSKVIFEILPRYRFRQEGDKVAYGDQLLFQNTSKQAFIHYFKQPLLPLEDTSMESTYRPTCPQRRVQISSVFERYEVNMGTEPKQWEIFPFRHKHEDHSASRLIYGGSVIRIKHAESGGYICLDEEGKHFSGDMHAYLRIYAGAMTGEDSEEQFSTNQLFEVEIDTDSEHGVACLWEDQETKIPWKYRFRHLNSGRVLSVKTFQKNSKDIHVITSAQVIGQEHIITSVQQSETINTDQITLFNKEMEKSTLNNSLFILKSSTIDNDNNVDADCVVKIMSASNGFYLTSVKKKSDDEGDFDEGNETQDSAQEDFNLIMQQEGDDLDVAIEQVMGTEKKIYTPMNKEEFNYLKQQTLLLRKFHKEEDVFVIKKIEGQEVSDVMFIHSCVDPLKLYLFNIRKKCIEKLTVVYFAQLEELLARMIFFVTETESRDPFTCEGIPKRHRQKYMRETRVIDLLVDMLVYPFDENLYDFAGITQRHPVTRICQLVYRLLKHCVKDYNYNKFYVAQFIELYFTQSMTATEQNNFRAESMITELLKDNEVLLEKQITKETIINFVNLCKGQIKNERFLNLLATLCSCNGEAINSNQDDACEVLLEDEENNNALILKLHPSQDDYEIIIFEPEIDTQNQYLSMANLYQASLVRDQLRIFNYFKAVINLNAEMCLKRNYRGINSLVDVYPVEQVFHCTVSESIHLLLRAAFAKFFLHMHLEKDPLEEIIVPELSRMWPDIVQAKTKIPQAKVIITDDLLKLKPFVAQFFSDLGGVQKAFEGDFNTYIVEVLGLVEAMVRLGFYNSEADLIKIIDPLISLLDGSLDIVDQDQLHKTMASAPVSDMSSSQSLKKEGVDAEVQRQKRYKMNESNLLIMQTKNKIIRILQLVINIQNDVRLTQFLTEFYKDDEAEPLSDKESALIAKINQTHDLEEAFKEDTELQEFAAKVTLKVQQWINIAYADKKLNLKDISKADFVCVLLDLLLYESSTLVNNAFQLLTLFFAQKQSLIDLAATVQILEQETDMATFQSVRLQLAVMKREGDNAEFWLGNSGREELQKARNYMEHFDMLSALCVKSNHYPYDYSSFQNLIKSVVMQEVLKLKRSRGKEGNDMAVLNDVSEMMEDFNDDDPKVIGSIEQSDEQNQRMLRNLKAYEIALIIVRQKNLDEASSQGAYLRVLEKAYIFLIKWVRNNRENQFILLEKLSEFLEDIELGVHAFELIAEIFRNNEKVSFLDLFNIIKKVCTISDSLPMESPKKATLISFLAGFMSINGIIHKEKQILILNEITATNRKDSIHLFTMETGFEQLDNYREEMRRNYIDNVVPENSPKPEIYIPNELSYVISFIRILSTSGGGRNAMTELKCQSLFTLPDIVENLKRAMFCYPYKEACLDFLLQIYLDTEKNISEDNHLLLWGVVEVIYEDLKKYIEIKINMQKRLGGEEGRRGGSEPIGGVDVSRQFDVRDCYGSQPMIRVLESYIFSQVIPNLNLFLELRLAMNQRQTNIIRNSIRLIIEAARYCMFNNQYIRNINRIYKTILKIPQIKELADQLKNVTIEILQEHSSYDGDEGPRVHSIGVDHAQKLKAFMKCATISAELANEAELEFQQLIISINFVRKKSEVGFGGKFTIETQEVLQSLIRLTDVESDIASDLRQTALKVLTNVIETENRGCTMPSADWDSEDWSKFESEVVDRQNLMGDLGMVELVCRVLSNEATLGIKEECIRCSIALLIGGNEKCQMKFFEFIQMDAENILVSRLKETITTCYNLIKKTEIMKNNLNQKLFSIEAKIEEMISLLGNPEHGEVKKLEQQKMLIEEEMKEEQEKINANDKDPEYLSPKRAVKYLKMIYRFLQLLCENHNINLQNCLREQYSPEGILNGKTFDFVSSTARMLAEFQKVFSAGSLELGDQMLDSLIEFIQGPCQGNQDTLINAKIIDTSRDFIAGFEKLDDLLPLGFSEEEEGMEAIAEFKSKIVTLLLSLLEGETNIAKVNKMSFALDFEVVKERMLLVFTLFIHQTFGTTDIDISSLTIGKINAYLDKDSFEGVIKEAFELFILMQTLSQNSKVAKDNTLRKSFTQEQWRAYDFIRSHTGKIEVNMGGNLQNVFFPIRPVCHCISKETRSQLMINVVRESHSTKINGLMSAAPNLIDEMIHNQQISTSKFAMTPERLEIIHDISTFLSVIINFCMMASISRIQNFQFEYESEGAQMFVLIAGIALSISSGLLTLFYTITKGSLVTKGRWRDYIKDNKKIFDKFENEDRLDVSEMSIEMTHTILMTMGPEAPDFNVEEGIRNFGNIYTKMEYYLFNVVFFIGDGAFLYFLVYFMITLLSLIYLEIFYSLLLFDMVQRSPTLQNVIRSVTENGKNFALTFMLIAIVLLLYTLIGFFYMQENFVDGNCNKFENNPNENFCNNMMECYINSVTRIFRQGGGFGDVEIDVGWEQNEYYLFKLIYDMSYFIIVMIILFNMLFGIVIDTFAQLRDHKNEVDEDMHNICFICNIDRNTFDKYADGFDNHIERDHNLWSYLFYLVHLRSKEESDYTGIESYINEQFENEEIGWVPIMKSISLQGTKYETSEAPPKEEEE